MDTDFLKKIADAVSDRVNLKEGDHIDFPGKGYRPSIIRKGNFHPVHAESSLKRVCFVDGGETCLIRSPGLSLHFIRTLGMIMEKKKTVYSEASEFYALAWAESREDRIYYRSRIFPVGKAIVPGAIGVYSLDSRIRQGNDRASITEVSGILRRISELKMAARLVDKLSEGDSIVLDGTLETRFTSEQKAIRGLYEKAAESNVLVTALAKSTTLLTKNGISATTLLKSLGPEDAWYYHPVAEIDNDMHEAAIYFTKLHKKSGHVFRFEIYKEQAGLVDVGRVLGLLASGSKDLLLPGYPYGLIRADRLARVSENEKEYLKTKLLSRLPKSFGPDVIGDSVHNTLDSAY